MVDTKAWKAIALTFAGKLITAGWSAVKACALTGLHRTSWYRHLNPAVPAGITVPHPDRAYPNRITTAESEEFIEQVKPVLAATAPNQLWSWDITMLHGPGKHTYKLYTIMDVFSRKVVGHRVEHTETAALAAALITDAVTGNCQRPAVLHADNGAPMRAGTTLDLARSLGIALSYSRPRVSDDNPYSESLFKTVKYDLDFPRRFHDLDHARAHMAAFFMDYNTNHRHSGLNYYTPETVHHGHVEQARSQRQATLDACHARNPHRYRRKPTAPGAPGHAGINYKETNQLSQTA